MHTKKRNRIISVLMCFAVMISISFMPISAVAEKAAAYSGNSTISVDKPNPTIKVGETMTFEVYTDIGADINYDFNNSNVACEWGDWFGADDENSYFYITGVRAGTSVVTIYDDVNPNIKATINVTVVANDAQNGNSTISVNIPKPTVKVGETLNLEVYTDKGADITYECNNDNAACKWGDWFGDNDENSYFYITGVRAGTSVVTIYDDANPNVKATINVTVEADAETGAITLAKSKTILCLGTPMVLEIASNTTGYSSSSLIWKSSNEAVAKVSGGTVTGVGAGTATITVSTPGGISASCAVSVTDYAYLVGTTFRSIQRTYVTATYNLGAAYAFTDALGSDVVITYVNYTIGSKNFRDYWLYNLTNSTVSENADSYYDAIVNRAFGAAKVRAMDAAIEAKQAQVYLLGGKGRAYTLEPAIVKPEVNSVHTVGGSKYKVIASGAVRLIKAKNAKSVTVPASVSINGFKFNVKSIGAKAFKGTKATTVTIKTKLLTKASVKKSLTGSKVKTIKVKVGSKSANKKIVKKYKKYFTKANAGKKVSVK